MRSGLRCRKSVCTLWLWWARRVIIGDQQMASGAAQVAMGSSDRTPVTVSRGLPLVAVAATMQHDSQALMPHDDSPVQRFENLDGHTIAVKPGLIRFRFLVKRYNLAQVRDIPATYSVANFLNDPGYIQGISAGLEELPGRPRVRRARRLPVGPG